MTPASMAVEAGKTLDGRVILIVGAGGGLGSAAAVACARSGATVILLGRKPRRLDRVYAQVQDAGHMLHHDQPAAVAQLIEDFCSAT